MAALVVATGAAHVALFFSTRHALRDLLRARARAVLRRHPRLAAATLTAGWQGFGVPSQSLFDANPLLAGRIFLQCCDVRRLCASAPKLYRCATGPIADLGSIRTGSGPGLRPIRIRIRIWGRSRADLIGGSVPAPEADPDPAPDLASSALRREACFSSAAFGAGAKPQVAGVEEGDEVVAFNGESPARAVERILAAGDAWNACSSASPPHAVGSTVGSAGVPSRPMLACRRSISANFGPEIWLELGQLCPSSECNLAAGVDQRDVARPKLCSARGGGTMR